MTDNMPSNVETTSGSPCGGTETSECTAPPSSRSSMETTPQNPTHLNKFFSIFSWVLSLWISFFWMTIDILFGSDEMDTSEVLDEDKAGEEMKTKEQYKGVKRRRPNDTEELEERCTIS